MDKFFSPMVVEIPYCDPIKIFSIFSNQPWSIFLDSSKKMEKLGRYSFIAVDPFLKITSKGNSLKCNDESITVDNPFSYLKNVLSNYLLNNHKDLPPFQGGLAGYFGYDLCHHLEKLPKAPIDDLQFHDMAIGVYDLVISFDHEEERAWVFSSGYPYRDEDQRNGHAKSRCFWLIEKIKNRKDESSAYDCIHINQEITSNFTHEQYEEAVRKSVDYIYSGDIFEVNLSQRFLAKLPENMPMFKLYESLRKINPAPFSAYMNFNDTVISSVSPERFLFLKDNQVETRPIKGTRKRDKNLEEDTRLAQELLNSEKDKSENIMIVDLMRNDLSRVCLDNSINVVKLCGLESYATVHHLVSVITGELKPDLTAIDLLMSSFPGGSITGAPKIRAMEIIAEIEPNCRGPYCGSIGYIGFDGSMDTSITIRTYAIKNGVISFGAGGAIVADSNPKAEYQETLNKAWALRKVLSTEEAVVW